MAAACVVSAVAQVPDPVIGVTFSSKDFTTRGNINLTGTDAANHTAGVAKSGMAQTWVYQDPYTNQFVGTTDNTGGSYYWVKYNSTDAFGTAIANGGTWEILFRLNSVLSITTNTKGTTSNTGTAKILSSTQSGGFCIDYYVGGDNPENTTIGGLKFEYVTTKNNIVTTGNRGALSTDKWYHVIVTIDKPNHNIKLYLNGEAIGENSDAAIGGTFKYPNIGTTKRKTNMWFCLGGDPAELDAPAVNGSENCNRVSVAFANYYSDVLTTGQIAERYSNDTVQYYTKYAPATTSDMLWDVFPRKGGIVTDESPFHKIDITGTLNTDFNETYMRYEVKNSTPTSTTGENFAWRDYYYEPTILHALNNGMAIEVFCKSNSATPAAISSPLSFQQQGGIGLEFQTTGLIKFNYNNYGYDNNKLVKRNTTGLTDSLAPAAGARNLSLGTVEGVLTDGYTHYVCTTDRAGNISKIYINGVEAVSFSQPDLDGVATDMTRQSVHLCHVPWQWFCFNGDTNGSRHTGCHYPFDGNIVFGRVWGKYLTADDVTALYRQATGTSTVVTMQSNKLATAVFPYDAVVPAGATAYVVDVIKGSEANMVPYAVEGEVIPYGTPVIIKGVASTYTFEAADLNDAAVVAKIKDAPAKNLLVGSFATKKAKADQLYKISTSAAEFDKAAADDLLAAQQAWLPFEAGGEDALTLTENIVLTEAGGAALRVGYPEGYTATGKFSRTFKNAVSSTVCLPYAISSVSGGTLYSFDNITESEGEYTVHMSVASLPTTANTPYLFMPSADGEVTFSGTMTVPASMAAGNTTSGDWTFEGTYEKTTWSGLPAGSSAVYGYAAKAQNTINPGDFVKLKMTGEAYTPAFRAVMKYTGGASARSLKGTVPTLPSRLKVVLTDGNGNVTEIGSLEILQEQETWFTIDGKELQAKPIKRGIYIRNGKKVFVK